MNDPIIRWQHTPQYEAGRPVFPESPVLPLPFLLRGMRGWHWQVEIEGYTLQFFMEGNGCYEAGDRCHEIKTGDCFLFRPGERITGRAHTHRPATQRRIEVLLDRGEVRIAIDEQGCERTLHDRQRCIRPATGSNGKGRAACFPGDYA